MFEKSAEYWIAMIGAAAYVVTRDAEQAPVMRRIGKMFSSATLAIGMSGAVAKALNVDEVIAAVALMVLGQVVLDLIVGLFADRELIKTVIKARLGGRNG